MARSLSEPKACFASTVIRLQAYRLDDPALVDGVVSSRAKEKKVLVDYGASIEAARTRVRLRVLAAAGIEVRTITSADLSPFYGQNYGLYWGPPRNPKPRLRKTIINCFARRAPQHNSTFASKSCDFGHIFAPGSIPMKIRLQ